MSALALAVPSRLVLRGTGESEQGRIFAVDEGGVRTAVERTAVQPVPSAPQVAAFSNYYELSRPEVSRDGSILAVTGRRICLYADSCAGRSNDFQTTISGLPGGERNITGAGRLSGNGRYLLLYDNITIGHTPPMIVDLETGVSQGFYTGGILSGAGRVVADDGTVVIAKAAYT